MSEMILLGQEHQISGIPRQKWEEHLAQVPQHGAARLSFMSKEHHLIRNFVATELPRLGKPLSLEFISQQLNLPRVRVRTICDELEANLFFLVRDKQGAVSWVYPVTVERTPHDLTFSTGERLYGA